MSLRRPALASSLLFALAACAPVDPIYDDAIGVEAIPADEGALAGTFALKVRSLTLEDTGVLGEQEGGGTNLLLVTRAYDDEAGVYRQESRLCGGASYEVAGIQNHIPVETYQAVAPSTSETLTVDHARGTYRLTGHLQLWGLRNLPDPYKTPLPKDADEAGRPPYDAWVYDHEGDGKPGVTVLLEGFLSGEVYNVERKTFALEGVILGEDRALGLSRLTRETVQLGASHDLLSFGGVVARDHPDAKESWFEEIRLDDDATCDDVRAAAEDGRLPAWRSF